MVSAYRPLDAERRTCTLQIHQLHHTTISQIAICSLGNWIYLLIPAENPMRPRNHGLVLHLRHCRNRLRRCLVCWNDSLAVEGPGPAYLHRGRNQGCNICFLRTVCSRRTLDVIVPFHEETNSTGNGLRQGSKQGRSGVRRECYDLRFLSQYVNYRFLIRQSQRCQRSFSSPYYKRLASAASWLRGLFLAPI